MSRPAPLRVRVENLRNKNQFVISFKTLTSDEWLCFQSYSSECALWNISKGELWLNTDCWLSKTTSKHLYIFINEYTRLSVHNSKELKELIKEGVIKTYKR